MYLLAGGFALLEALVASGVLGFGLLAIGRLQFALYGNSDLAKQRSEAVQLGERKIEDLRAYSALGSYQAMAAGSGSDTVAGTSASYTRTWTFGNSAITAVAGTYPVYKAVRMVVSWTSRANATETVTMDSIVAMYDLAAGGQVVVPPAGTPTRKPRNRDVNIPWPAVKLGDGTSAFHPPGSSSGYAIVFDDATGVVSATCTNATLPTSDNTSGTPTDTSGWGCTDFNGFIFSGYIGHPGSSPPINFHISFSPAANTSVGGTASLIQCFDDIGTSGTGAEVYPGFVSYICLINTASSNDAYSGTTTFSGQTFASPPVAVTWGTTSGSYFICRYTPAGGVAYPYVDVKKSLLNQNYLLKAGANGNPSCPTGTVQHTP
jgi:hypothetical protein